MIGEQKNFNTFDGSGHIIFTIKDSITKVVEWIQEQQKDMIEKGIILSISKMPIPLGIKKPSTFGIDIREILSHKRAVETWINAIRRSLEESGTFTIINNRPSWRCPSDHKDLIKLEAAYEEVIGQPSPNLVKLHGNDGGSLAQRQQAQNAWDTEQGLGNAVVFGQVGRNPHGKGEFHRAASIGPYWEILNRWAAQYTQSTA